MGSRSAILLTLGLLLAGCPGPKAKDGAVRVGITLDSFRPGCLLVQARDWNGSGIEEVQLSRSALKDSNDLVLAVFRDQSWSTELGLSVRSFERDCTGVPVEQIDRTEPITVTPNQVAEWNVALVAKDEDGDGYAQPSPAQNIQGTDCNDQAATIHPSATESCDLVDTDCDGLKGCADLDCAGQLCDDLNPCTSEDLCRADRTCAGKAVTCDTPPSGCHQAVGACSADGGCLYAVNTGLACSDGGTCRSDGMCIFGETLCADGLDNDQDSLTDCADPDCLDQACSDGVSCTVSDRCVADGGCVGTPLVCLADAGPCLNPNGYCDGGACFHPPLTGLACSDGNACTLADMCLGDGGCGSSSPVSCNVPPAAQCYATPGTCHMSDGGCAYSITVGASCDDSMTCTFGDSCQADAGCSGIAYNCAPPPSQCHDAGVCAGDGGCNYPVRENQPCDAGLCNGAGSCIATGPFPFIPLNFVPGDHSPGPAITMANCNATFDSSGDAGFTTWCGGGLPQPSVSIVNNGDAGEAVVLAFSALTLNNTSSLTLEGSRPVIIAVYGNASVEGDIMANSRRSPLRVGPGGNALSCGPSTGGDGSDGGQGGGGGGGAGYGTDGGAGGEVGNEAVTPGAAGIYRAPTTSPLVGGCAGGTGASGTRAQGGPGGGALQLSVAGELTVNSDISVSGGGGNRAEGSPSARRPGGGGGGSGGTLILEANRINLNGAARLTANGGSGGGGTNESTANPGLDGTTSGDSPVMGGSGSEGGGNGGQGGARTGAPTAGESKSNRGAGGGGGSAGAIWLIHRSTLSCDGTAAIISPDPIRVNCP